MGPGLSVIYIKFNSIEKLRRIAQIVLYIFAKIIGSRIWTVRWTGRTGFATSLCPTTPVDATKKLMWHSVILAFTRK